MAGHKFRFHNPLHAIESTETLKGENNPSGRLPITFPDTEGQIPGYYNHLRWKKNYVDVLCGRTGKIHRKSHG